MSRITLLKAFFLTFSLAIVGRTAYLQIVGDERLERLAKRQFSSKVTALPRRGVIFDRNGEGLAISLKVRSLFFRPDLFRKELTKAEKNRVIFNLAQILRKPVKQLFSKANSERGFVWVKRQLSDSEEKSIRDRGLLAYGDALGLAEETKRFYPNKELASQILGTVNVDGQGLEGLELFYEEILSGEQVRISSNKDAMGRKIFRDDKGLLAFKDGQSLVLTIDKAIQYEAEKALKSSIEEHRAKSGTAIVADVATGEILAMANYPTFNPNYPRHAPQDSRRNRAITDSYEPGSTFKPLVVGYALDNGKSPKTQIYCERGSFKVGGRRISEAESHEKFEWLTLGEILKFSSNVGSAKLALELGPSNMRDLMEKLGVGKRTEIDLPGEAAGQINFKRLTSSVRLANVDFGHGFTVTPLQMLSYYLALANGGKWIQPKLVKAVLSEDPESIEKGSIRWKLGQRFDSVKTKQIFSPTAANQVTAMLQTVTEDDGTGVAARLEEWPVAGKTGTAQKVDPETKRYSKSKYVASFAGFAPATSPKLVALVIIDEPQKKYYASETAAPVFREIMRASLLRERVAPIDSSVKLMQIANRSSVELIAAETSAIAKSIERLDRDEKPESNDRKQIRLPDLTGLTVREALRTIGDQPLDIEVLGSGVLKEQVPASGVWLESGARVRLFFQSNL